MSINQWKRSEAASTTKKEQPSGSGLSMRYRERFASFAQDTAGDVAVIFGLMTMAMFILIGAAVDLGRWLNARDQTIAAIDLAVLAAGRALQTNGGNRTDAVNTAKIYYQQAVSNRLVVKNDTVSFAVVDDGSAVQATGNAEINTPFMRLAGINQLPLLKLTGSEHPKSVLGIGGNAQLNLEISMMLDVSGSMGSGSKLDDMKAAAADLVDIVVWQDQSKYTSKVAIVPFSGDVRPPAAMLPIVTPPVSTTWPLMRRFNNRDYTKTACVAERNGTNKFTDAMAEAGAYVTPAYSRTGACSTPQSGTVLPLTNDKPALFDKINQLTLGGATGGHIGTAWAYYMLSPKWSSVLTGVSLPAAYNAPKTQKIAILMTDGEYNSTYSNTGLPSGDGAGNGNGSSSIGQAISICNQMKQQDIDVYTIGFDLGGNSTAINTLKNCSSDNSKFYTAENGEQLKAVFRDIALKVSTLYLSK